MKILSTLSYGCLCVSSALHGLDVDVQRMGDPYLPWGYTDTTPFKVDEDPNIDGRQNYVEWFHSDSIQVSEAPFVDYFVAFNSGVAGVLAEKIDGPYLNAAESTISFLSGGANGGYVPDYEDRQYSDRYASGEMPVGSELLTTFASWTDGKPLPSATSWFGVSWGGFSATEVEEMEVRVNLASDGPVNVAHLFNDGWYYSSDIGNSGGGTPHIVLDGHEFSITHYSADGSVVAEVPLVLPSGGAETLASKETGITFWPSQEEVPGTNIWKQFYTATITATRQAEGDYLILKHRAGNIGYRMTLVTLGNDRPWDEGSAFALTPGEYSYDDYLGWTYGNTPEIGQSQMLGWVYVPNHPVAIYSYTLGWLLSPSGKASTGLFYYRFNTSNWIWTNENYGGFYWDYASSSWGSVF